jgi:hypothetical protein
MTSNACLIPISHAGCTSELRNGQTSLDVSRETSASNIHKQYTEDPQLAHKLWDSFPDTKVRKKPIEDVLHIYSSRNAAHGPGSQPNILGDEFERPLTVELSQRTTE